MLHALRRLLRWLHDPRHAELSDYMLASEARLLMDEIAPELRAAGVRGYEANGTGVDYWPQFVEMARHSVVALA